MADKTAHKNCDDLWFMALGRHHIVAVLRQSSIQMLGAIISSYFFSQDEQTTSPKSSWLIPYTGWKAASKSD